MFRYTSGGGNLLGGGKHLEEQLTQHGGDGLYHRQGKVSIWEVAELGPGIALRNGQLSSARLSTEVGGLSWGNDRLDLCHDVGGGPHQLGRCQEVCSAPLQGSWFKGRA